MSTGEQARSWSVGPRRVRVLVVDDEASIRSLCRINLELAGLDVSEAQDGLEAIALVRNETFDVVLLDVMMPHVDGWEVAELLAGDDSTRNVPVVFLTARADPGDFKRGFDLGAVGYVRKPFDPVPLAGYLRRILDGLARGEREALRREILEAS